MHINLDHIPVTHLPEGWDAPLQNPVPHNIPQVPVPHRRRGRRGAAPASATLEDVAQHAARQQAVQLADLQRQQRDIALAELQQQRQQQRQVQYAERQQRDVALAELQLQQQRQRQAEEAALAAAQEEQHHAEFLEQQHLANMDLDPEHRQRNQHAANQMMHLWHQEQQADLELDFNDEDDLQQNNEPDINDNELDQI
ncbi:hypothetical protein H0H87_012651, partial [Tephrocybe sp. NHM501043]